VRKPIKIGLVTTAVLLLVAMLPMRRVAGDEMSPTIRAGDVVWVLPGIEVRRGDVVALPDPLDPSRTVLRRAIAPGGTKALFTEDGIRVDAKRLRQKDMGKLDGYGVYQETLWSKPPAKAVEWLIRRRRTPPVHWEADAVEVPQGHWYVLADDRDNAVDSRWWGPVPAESIIGVVRLRYGPSDLWRKQLEVLLGTP